MDRLFLSIGSNTLIHTYIIAFPYQFIFMHVANSECELKHRNKIERKIVRTVVNESEKRNKINKERKRTKSRWEETDKERAN